MTGPALVWLAKLRAGLPYHAPDNGRTRCGRMKYAGPGEAEAVRGHLLPLVVAVDDYEARPCLLCWPELQGTRYTP